MDTNHLHSKRSFTGHHILLPASQSNPQGSSEDHECVVVQVPTYTLVSWTFGRGSVIWRIWPAVLLHTVFAAGIVTLSLRTEYSLEIPGVMLTVLGVVIGFVISYRAMSGYDRYWMGRGAWSDLIRNARTAGRLIWFHIPLRFNPEDKNSGEIKYQDKAAVMAEKRLALDLIEAFAVAVKHHIRGELGIYFEDLYPLVRPLHKHDDSLKNSHSKMPLEPPPRKGPLTMQSQSVPSTSTNALDIPSRSRPPPAVVSELEDPVIPPVNAYGTFNLHRNYSSSSSSSRSSNRNVLLPSSLPKSQGILSKVSGDLIPFASFVNMLRLGIWRRLSSERPLEVLPPNVYLPGDEQALGGQDGGVQRKWRGTIERDNLTHAKHRPRVAGDGENLPLEILQCLSEWFSVLEERGTVPGTSLGALIGCIATFEDNLSTLEKILTTPIPFVYSVHISTVWLYLFFLPFQLVRQFGWHTIPGVGIAAFIYLGFLAAGEEIEQPFGYDENDLDLDLFCREIIHADMEHLKNTHCANAYFSPDHREHHRSIAETIQRQRESDGHVMGF